MFGSIFDAVVDVAVDAVDTAARGVGHTVGLASDIVTGEGITSERVGSLLAAGYSAYQISDMFGVSVAVVEKLMD